jgi:hypothetical protein
MTANPKFDCAAPVIIWEWLHGAVATALRRIGPGAPLYVTADVLTDELLPPLNELIGPVTEQNIQFVHRHDSNEATSSASSSKALGADPNHEPCAEDDGNTVCDGHRDRGTPSPRHRRYPRFSHPSCI